MRRAAAERLAEEETVVTIDQPVSVLGEKRIPPLERRSKKIEEFKACWHYRPLHYPEQFRGFGKIIRRINRGQLRRELDELVPRDTRRIICYDSPTQNHLVGKLGEDVNVYLAIDDRTLTVGGDVIAGEIEAERALLGKVDKVICVSEVLAGVLRSRIPGGRRLPVHVLSNGYDERLFDPERKLPEPPLLVGIPRPRIVVTGHVSERIDWEGVAGAVNARPNWTWVFVGPADPEIPKKIGQFSVPTTNRSNGEDSPRILWRGAVPVEEVPAWIGHSDACAVPYRLNAFTRASSPLKAIEYLAMGVPVISTRVPSLEQYAGAIQWIEEGDGDSYARGLDKIMVTRDDAARSAARRAAVTNESWAIKMNHFRKMVLNDEP